MCVLLYVQRWWNGAWERGWYGFVLELKGGIDSFVSNRPIAHS
ncbi:MAG: hypothetical protein ACI9UN_004333 [Granulosicoccus sp.]|jgi:hypothetical protein